MAQDRWALSSLDAGMSVRSRYIFAERIAPVLVEQGMDAQLAVTILQELKAELLGESKKAGKERKKKGADTEEPQENSEYFRYMLKTEQVIVLGVVEIQYIIAAAKEIAQAIAEESKATAEEVIKKWFTKERRENLRTLQRAAGLDAALFGRMVTSDVLARGDAAVHVAHAFTVHREASETDYFSAVDDLEQEEGALGSGHIGNTELTSGLFYNYVVIDIPLLVSNLGGDQELARKTIEHFMHLIATVSPGAKLGSTAPYARANLLLVERGAGQPRTLADAFLQPVRSTQDRSLVEQAITDLATHIERLDKMYGNDEERAYASYYSAPFSDTMKDVQTLDALAVWASDILPANTKAAA
jgi:CRISPR system Cascade subunit CasC